MSNAVAGPVRRGGVIDRARTVLPWLLSVLLILGSVGPVSAQDAGDQPRWWIGLGVGTGHVPDDTGILSTLVQATVQSGAHQLSLRVPYLTSRNESEFQEYGLAYSRVLLRNSAHVSAGGGVSYVRACRGFDGLSEECDGGWGIPLVAEGALHKGFIGLGIQGFANLNRMGSYTGVALFVQVGRLR